MSLTLIFADGAAFTVPAGPGANVVEAAEAAGLQLLTDCREGRCATCMCDLLSGEIELGDYDPGTLDDEDYGSGKRLACVSTLSSPSVALEFPYDSDEAVSPRPPIPGRVIEVVRPAEEAIGLVVEIDQALDFLPGQYVRLRPQGADFQRSFSMANAPGVNRLIFWIRDLPDGRFSQWAKSAQAGDQLEVSAPHGAFFLRPDPRPSLFIAGGTGLGPFLAMLESLAGDPARAAAMPMQLIIGARSEEHLFELERVETLAARIPGLTLTVCLDDYAGDRFHAGRAVDAIAGLDLDPATRAYVCGPPAMVDAARPALVAAGVAHDQILCERFT